MKGLYKGQVVRGIEGASKAIREADKLLVTGVKPVEAKCNCGAGRRESHSQRCRLFTAPQRVNVMPLEGGKEVEVADTYLEDATVLPAHLAEHAA